MDGYHTPNKSDQNLLQKRQFFEQNFLQRSTNNKQNCIIWGSENSQVIEERPLHTEEVTLWCAICSKGMVGWDTAQYVSKNGQKFSQKNQCLQHEWMNEWKMDNPIQHSKLKKCVLSYELSKFSRDIPQTM